jgi:hypothetical protein
MRTKFRNVCWAIIFAGLLALILCCSSCGKSDNKPILYGKLYSELIGENDSILVIPLPDVPGNVYISVRLCPPVTDTISKVERLNPDTTFILHYSAFLDVIPMDKTKTDVRYKINKKDGYTSYYAQVSYYNTHE